MAITERERRDIYVGLEETLGSDAANNLMTLLPQQPAAELVTRTDMHANTTMLRGEMAELRAELRNEMAELRAELRSEMAELRGELKDELIALRTSQSRWTVSIVAANTIAMVTALIT